MGDRREFLQRSAVVGVSGLLAANQVGGDELTPNVAAELKNRLRFLSTPDGIASDLDARPSPLVKPFTSELFVPSKARPLIDLTKNRVWEIPEKLDRPDQARKRVATTSQGYQQLDNGERQRERQLEEWMRELVRKNIITHEALRHMKPDDRKWLIVFWQAFHELSEKLLALGLDLGHFPMPLAHQRFFEFKPLKFYAIWELEFPWRFADRNCKAAEHDGRRDRPARKGASWTEGSWSWGFGQLVKGWDKKQVRNSIDLELARPQVVMMGQVPLEASSPGPTFEAVYAEPILVRRINALPEILNDDHTWTATPGGTPRRHIKFALPSTTTHLHNAHTASESDGHPNDWINPGEYWDHHYGNFASGYDRLERLSTLWYHDHRMDFTASNVYAGLDGFYLLFDEPPADGNALRRQLGDINRERDPNGWQLPSGEHDIPLIFHDLLFDRDDDGTAQLVFDGFNTDGILGDRYTANRVIQPVLHVKKRKYRFRLLNGGPSRFYDFFLHTANPKEYDEHHRGHPFILLCGDGNFQPNPLLARSVYLGVAQRTDVIIDFTAFDAREVYLVNRLQQKNGRGPNGRQDSPASTSPEDIQSFLDEFAIVKFVIEDDGEPDESKIPITLRDLPPVDLTEVRRERTWNFDYDGGLWTINGLTYDPNRIDAGIEQDSAEIWVFRNTGNSWSHPIHSHFTEFIVLEINGVPQYQYTVQGEGEPRQVTPKTRFFDPSQYRKMYEAIPKKDRAKLESAVRDYGKSENKSVTKQKLTKTLELPFPRYLEFADDVNQCPLGEDCKQHLVELDFPGAPVDSLKGLLIVVEFLREYFDVELDLRDILGREQGDGRFMGGPRRDVALILPSWEVKVFMRWKDFLGKHVMHCHNVVHEDHAMMIRWDILPPGHGFDTPKYTREVYGREDGIPRVQPQPGQAHAADDDNDLPQRR